MDWMTPAETVQEQVDYMLDGPYKLKVRVDRDAVFIFRDKGCFRTTADHPVRFPLSKLRKDQLDKIHEIMEKQNS